MATGLITRELEVAAFGDEIPRRVFGQNFRFCVGKDVVAIGIGPVPLGERLVALLMAVADGGE